MMDFIMNFPRMLEGIMTIFVVSVFFVLLFFYVVSVIKDNIRKKSNDRQTK